LVAVIVATYTHHLGWELVVLLGIEVVWFTAAFFGSPLALRLARRLGHAFEHFDRKLDRIRSWHPVTQAVLALSIAIAVVVLGNVINR
jgi:hypothetical protein